MLLEDILGEDKVCTGQTCLILFEQLLAVLPAASKSLLPPCFQWLMTSPESPIIDSYPVEFEQVRDKEPYFGLKVNFISLRDLYQTGFPMVKVWVPVALLYRYLLWASSWTRVLYFAYQPSPSAPLGRGEMKGFVRTKCSSVNYFLLLSLYIWTCKLLFLLREVWKSKSEYNKFME